MFSGYGKSWGLLCHSWHTVMFDRPDPVDRIRQCEDIGEVFDICAELAEFARHDWDDIARSTRRMYWLTC